MYRKLMQDMSDDRLHIQQQWELELHTVVDEDLWKDVPNVTRRLEDNTGKSLTRRSKQASLRPQ